MSDRVYAKKKFGPRRDAERYQHIATAELHGFGRLAPYFAITVDTWRPNNTSLSEASITACGCQHDVVRQVFPELVKYLKWHLTSTDGPMHYIANTLYHASDKDCWGLRKDEKRQLVNGRTKLPVWHLVVRDEEGNEVQTGSGTWVDAAECPGKKFTAGYEPRWVVGEGKAREFDAARHSAVWPEATDEQLSLPKEELEKLLQARHSQLMAEFQADMVELFGSDTWTAEYARVKEAS